MLLQVVEHSVKENSVIIPQENAGLQPCCSGKILHYSNSILLCAHSITLGGFGIDRFYLEQWGSAVGKLVSFGGLGVWTILDVILVATGYLTPADGSLYIY